MTPHDYQKRLRKAGALATGMIGKTNRGAARRNGAGRALYGKGNESHGRRS